MWNCLKVLQDQPKRKLMSHFIWAGIILLIVSSNPVLAAFAVVDCSNAAHLTTLEIPQEECEALEALWDSTDGPNWTTNTWWDSLNEANSWHGIWASGGHVTRVIPYDNNLVGTIPPQLGNLSMMEYLDLSRNQITGPIPPEFGALSNLTNLVLQFNQINGSLPPQIGNMTSLVNMRVDNNQISGSLIPELGNLANLAWLEIHHNQLGGSIPIEFQNLAALSKLQLAVNQLSGRIPDLSSLPLLNSFQLPGNFFVFADIEPEWLSYRNVSFSPQGDVDTDRADNFAAGATLTITPQMAVNPSGNDHYQWRKDGVIIPGPTGTQRIFSKTAEASDTGLYWYSVTNTVVTSGQLNATNTANTGIHITIGQAPPPSDYSVGGSVAGLNGNLILQNNAGDDLALNTNGDFTFVTLLADLSPYLVTVSSQPLGQTCSVSNGSGNISGANITNVAVSCVDDVIPTYTVGGTTTGLTGSGLELQNNGVDALSIAVDGGFVFATELDDLSAYAVTVSSQPTGQTCSVSNGSGTIAAANVTDVAVDCIDDQVPPVIPDVPATPIPTLSEWALITLFVLLGLVVVSTRRRVF